MKISSAIEICNLALLRIEQASISSLNDDTIQGHYCKLVYEQSKSSLLSSYNWTFAIKDCKLTLAQIIDNDMQRVGDYVYFYQLPHDLLRVVSAWDVNDRELIQITNMKPPFIVEGKYIKSDCPDLKLKYVADMDAVNDFSPLFIDCLVLDLATRLTKLFNSSTTYLQMLTMEFKQKIEEAQIADCQQTMLSQIKSYPLLFSTWGF